MHIDIFTLFPQMFDGPLTESILKRAQEHELLSVARHDIRNWTTDKHRTADDTPYGGGGGMIMKPQPILDAVEAVLGDQLGKVPVILTTPQGQVFNQRMAKELASYERLAFICGRYEGIDERVRDLVVTHEISIGDFVLTGGELPVMVMIDAIARHLPGVLGEEGAADDDSHATGLLEHPYYTRPPVFRGLAVPPELLTGSHRVIERWRRDQAIRRTWARRPDLLLTADLTDAEKYLLADLALAWLDARNLA
ncbi:MAG: tRNA (guanosine(37)-N1)-methyltransferase TrmD [Anaerolineae bacterium]|nr:tRNA (guanosine(37)-N1)-methyltransferase TrmD [Anaerolineae bacterium]